MENDEASNGPKQSKVTGRRVLYWIGGLFVFAALFNTAARLIDPDEYERRQERLAHDQTPGNGAHAADAVVDKDINSQLVRDGSHCLSAWDGSNRSLKELIKNAARNPGSFEHIDTRIRPAVVSDQTGRLEHPVVMRFRSENGFGGMNVGVAVASVDNETCSATLINVSER